MKKQNQSYADIIDLPHPVSKKHPLMPRQHRAVQFAPFAALTGHKEAVAESSRITEEKIELDEYKQADLDRAMQEIVLHIQEYPTVQITYFQKDALKTGGSYFHEIKNVKEIDEVQHRLLFTDRSWIAIQDIYEIVFIDQDTTIDT